MELITLQTFHLAHKAYLLKSILDNEGIESYIYDEHIVTAQPMYANTVEGIKLKIRKRDFEKACEALKGTHYEVIFQKEEEPQNSAKHIFLIIFSKETILVAIILYVVFKIYSRG